MYQELVKTNLHYGELNSDLTKLFSELWIVLVAVLLFIFFMYRESTRKTKKTFGG